jgi:hypothetical protein
MQLRFYPKRLVIASGVRGILWGIDKMNGATAKLFLSGNWILPELLAKNLRLLRTLSTYAAPVLLFIKT